MKIVQIQIIPESDTELSRIVALTDDGRLLYRRDPDCTPGEWLEIPGPQAPEPATDYKAQRDELAGLLRHMLAVAVLHVEDREETDPCDDCGASPLEPCDDHCGSSADRDAISRARSTLAKLKDTP